METPTPLRLLDAALTLLGEHGSSGFTLRATEDAANVPHGSVRHHFGSARGLLLALPDHLANVEGPAVRGSALAIVKHLVGPGRTTTLARYELFLMAARDPRLRDLILAGRARFEAQAAERTGPGAPARAAVAALDGVVLDALLRGRADPGVIEQLTPAGHGGQPRSR